MVGRAAETSALLLPGGDWTVHELRRSGATIMGDLSVRSDVIEKCLNHVEEKKIRRTYQRAEMLAERRLAFDALGQQLELLTAKTSTRSS